MLLQFDIHHKLVYLLYMNEKDNREAILEGKIEGINNAIAVSRANATPATRANVEMAIEELALPELEKVQAELAEIRKAS